MTKFIKAELEQYNSDDSDNSNDSSDFNDSNFI